MSVSSVVRTTCPPQTVACTVSSTCESLEKCESLKNGLAELEGSQHHTSSSSSPTAPHDVTTSGDGGVEVSVHDGPGSRSSGKSLLRRSKHDRSRYATNNAHKTTVMSIVAIRERAARVEAHIESTKKNLSTVINSEPDSSISSSRSLPGLRAGSKSDTMFISTDPRDTNNQYMDYVIPGAISGAVVICIAAIAAIAYTTVRRSRTQRRLMEVLMEVDNASTSSTVAPDGEGEAVTDAPV
jgi:hypothetical protein